jgi:hypothetical protein
VVCIRWDKATARLSAVSNEAEDWWSCAWFSSTFTPCPTTWFHVTARSKQGHTQVSHIQWWASCQSYGRERGRGEGSTATRGMFWASAFPVDDFTVPSGMFLVLVETPVMSQSFVWPTVCNSDFCLSSEQ